MKTANYVCDLEPILNTLNDKRADLIITGDVNVD